jgi:hypothetical protein
VVEVMPSLRPQGFGKTVIVDDGPGARAADRSDCDEGVGVLEERRVPRSMRPGPEPEDYLFPGGAQVELGVESGHGRQRATSHAGRTAHLA